MVLILIVSAAGSLPVNKRIIALCEGRNRKMRPSVFFLSRYPHGKNREKGSDQPEEQFNFPIPAHLMPSRGGQEQGSEVHKEGDDGVDHCSARGEG
jgi:hypothetical protein